MAKKQVVHKYRFLLKPKYKGFQVCGQKGGANHYRWTHVTCKKCLNLRLPPTNGFLIHGSEFYGDEWC